MYRQYRHTDILVKLNTAGFHPLDIMVTGVTGAGKSTTLNTLFQKDIAKVGEGVDPETMSIESYSLTSLIRLWDTPGLGDGLLKDQEHSKKMIDLLYKTYHAGDTTHGWIDLVLVIIEGSNRDMGTSYKLLNDIIIPSIQEKRILVAINQADMAMKGRHWDYVLNQPEAELKAFLDSQAVSIKNRIKEATGVDIMMPVYYSAEYNYNLKKLFDLIIDNLPNERRLLTK